MSAEAAGQARRSRPLFKDRLLDALVECYATDNGNALQNGLYLDERGPYQWTFISCARLASQYIGMHPNTYTKDLRQYAGCILRNTNVRVLGAERMGDAADAYYWNVYQMPDELIAQLRERIAAVDQERASSTTTTATTEPEQHRRRIRLLVSRHLDPHERRTPSPGLEYYDAADTLVSLVH